MNRPLLLCASLLAATPALAHFQTLLPSRDTVADPEDASLLLQMQFTHPMEQGPLMHMAQPVRFGVAIGPARIDLREALVAQTEDGITAYSAEYQLAEPGDHVFFLEPAPYWESAEGTMIIHYTKVVVDAFGAEEGWDQLVGFPVEIEPLVRPYGLWAGNTFRGIVRKNGEPVPFAKIEIEYWNEGRIVDIPAPPFVTQVIKAGPDGSFAYTMPRAGWWGFAALITADTTMLNPQGEAVPVEQGGLIWVKTVDINR